MAEWKLGSRPEGHPLWQEQVELEMQMVQRGADKYRSRLSKALDKEEMTAMRPYRRVLEDMVETMAVGLRGWMNGTAQRKGSPGAVHIAYSMLKASMVPPEVAAYVTARSLLDGLIGRHKRLLHMALMVGMALEYEARMQLWLTEEPGLFTDTSKKLHAQRATSRHRKRVNINTFNRLLRKKHTWRDWSHDEKLHTGLKLIEILARTSGHIQVVPDPDHINRRKRSAPYVVMGSDELIQYLEEGIADDRDKHPQYLPCVVPPKRWEGVRRGGYYSPLVRIPRLIRFKADNEEVQGIATDEYDSLDMPRVYEALNKIQEVPWRINKRVLAVVLEAWQRDLGLAGLSRQQPAPLPPPHPGQRREDLRGLERRAAEAAWIAENPKAFKEWRKRAAKVYGENARRVSHGTAVATTIEIAEKLADREFYFPHMLDFRGRMYPIPVYLQPQGNDLARGLLTFAHGRPLGEWGEYWLAIHVANTWEQDKISFDDRRTWTVDNWDMLARVAADPLRNREWCKLKEPWQALAAAMEYYRVASSDNPAGEVSALPIRVDGTCNGIQHLSALMRDEVGGASVNLLPSESPRDIYAEVGTILKGLLEGIAASGGHPGTMAATWLRGLNGDVPRSLTKRPVMVTPYGGTASAYKTYILDWLRDNVGVIRDDDPALVGLKTKKGADMPPTLGATLWLVPRLWDSVAGRVTQARVCMEWLQECAKLLVETGQPILWTTSTGFRVRHFYGTLRRRQIETVVDGKKVYLAHYDRTKALSKKEQLQGIAPNFVHSQDAAVNMETILEFMQGDDPPPFTTIHDAFGTVPGAMWDLFGCIRRSFVGVHSEDVLDAFRQQCVILLRDHYYATQPGVALTAAWESAEDMVPPVPPRGNLNIKEVLNADYFFA